ncbi:MAG: TIGR01777 family oxidoreductase, partial [Candidatus Acidiferrum sp.]
PKVLVSASAIGYYGSRGDELLTEESGPRTSFLSRLAEEWEAEAVKAQVLGMRVVRVRFGVILAKGSGALPQMMLPFKIGAGGKLGSGKQWMSWVALDDVVRAIRFVIEDASLGAAVNVTAPQPVTNAEFTKVLAHTMHRPALFTVPPFALRTLLGEMADEMLLSSQRVVPRVLLDSGFQFRYPDLPSTLKAILQP